MQNNDTLSARLERHAPLCVAFAAGAADAEGRLACGAVNLADALLGPAHDAPQRAALVGPEPCSYAELAARAAAVAAGLAGAGIAPGDRVAILAGNEAVFVAAYLGVLRAGAVAVPLNPASPSHEVARELDVVRPRMLLASPAHADLARRAASQSASATPVRTLDAGETADVAQPAVARDGDDLAVLLFTAGTAGAPKPAMLTHGSLLSNLEQMQSHPGVRLRDSDVSLGVLPLFHVYGLNVVLGLSLRSGAAISLVDHFHPVETLARVRGDGVTVIAAVPAIFAAWLALDTVVAPAEAFVNVRLCVSGAAALDPHVARAMRDRFGIVVYDGYGLSEASPVVTASAVVPEPRPGSVGPPLPGVEVRLVDADGVEVLEGDPGEILVRGPNVFAGYWDDPAATAAVLADGWLHTGDIAVADADGWLTLVDRAKDVIIVSGFNVYPGEVEDALRGHPDVADVAVIGEPHPRTGETVAAFVVPREGRTPDRVELLRHAGRQLARYKLPTRLEVVESLPRTLAGKLVRRALSDRAAPPLDATTNPA
jgi:long-chain acyl-CoA synthetase